MALAEAYFDESGTGEDAKDLCLAGYIFEKDAAIAFDAEWRSMLSEFGLPYFHMKECAHNIGVYAHLDRDACDRAARGAIEIIKAHASQGVAISVDKAAAHDLRAGSMWVDSYSFIANQVLFAVRKWADKRGFDGAVHYLFEAGARGWGNAHEAALTVINDPELKRDFRVATFATGLKADHTPLQAADMLAWHWLKYNRNRRNGVTAKRADFKALLRVKTDAHHYDQTTVEQLRAIRSLDPAVVAQLDAALRNQ